LSCSWSVGLCTQWKKPGSSLTSMTTNDSQPVPGGEHRIPALPQSKLSVCTSSLLMNLLTGLPSGLDCLAPRHDVCHGNFRRQPLHARRAEESDHAGRPFEHVG